MGAARRLRLRPQRRRVDDAKELGRLLPWAHTDDLLPAAWQRRQQHDPGGGAIAVRCGVPPYPAFRDRPGLCSGGATWPAGHSVRGSRLQKSTCPSGERLSHQEPHRRHVGRGWLHVQRFSEPSYRWVSLDIVGPQPCAADRVRSVRTRHEHSGRRKTRHDHYTGERTHQPRLRSLSRPSCHASKVAAQQLAVLRQLHPGEEHGQWLDRT